MAVDRSKISALMDRASTGDRDAFAAVASAVRDELYRLALAHALPPEDAADATQEALLRAYAGRGKWKPGADAMAWLCGIAVNVVRECHRRRRQRAAGLFEPGSYGAYDWVNRGAGRDGNWGPEPIEQLMEAIGRLPPRQREAIACRYLRRMSIRETAEAMGCAEGTVKSAVSAALERLREILQRIA